MKKIYHFVRKFFRDAFSSATHRPPIYIFDLDGTLSLADARRHFVDKEDPDWTAFHRAASRDKPNNPVMLALHAALAYGCDVRIWSGRSAEVYEASVHWLSVHLDLPARKIESMLKMRREGDLTPDQELKESWLHALPHDEYMRIQAVYDDRNKVVDMWRRNNIPCFQVAPGEF